jgi:transglutaminase-like putative cysteine protease
MKISLSIIALFFLITSSMAADPKYPVGSIPEALKKNNYGVIREQIIESRILAKNRLVYYEKHVVTILNQNGKFLSRKSVGYDKLNKIQFIRAAIYDADGMLVRRIKQSDIYDHSEFESYTLFSDNRYKSLDLSYHTYPYTFELEYEVEQKYLYSLRDFRLYRDDEVGIEKSTYSLIYPPELKPRYKLISLGEPRKTVEGTMEKLTWIFENFQPPKFERSFSKTSDIPRIMAVPFEFEYEGYAGKMDSWENLGAWQYQLLNGRDELPEPTKQKVHALIAGKKNDSEKIKVLYEYMQSKTRYVNIAIGIGDLQPLEAKLVDQVGYGDCKALSNYMVSLLKVAGIKGYFTTVWMGPGLDVITDFPDHQANHAIVAVPMREDTVWLECTSQIAPFNFLGTDTQNRWAVMITENGGKLVRTPGYEQEKNTMIRQATITLNADGRGIADVSSRYSDARYDDEGVGTFCNYSADMQKKWLQKNLQISAYDVISYSFRDLFEEQGVAKVDFKLSLPNAATVNGKRIFLTPNLMNRSNYVPEKLEKRRTPIILDLPYIDIDSIVYIIPEGIYPEYLPPPVKLSSRFGEYECSFIHTEGKLQYHRKFSVPEGTFPPETYNELTEFMKAVQKADNMKIVFLNKT